MHICNTLSQVVRQHVEFDPENPEHLRAFQSLVIGDETGTIRQHSTLRFVLTNPFTNVRSMMIHKIGEKYLADHGIVEPNGATH